MNAETATGDLLDQEVEAIVNAWNRNIIPWWLLIPQGVSRAIKRRAGLAPFRELARLGPIPLGGAVHTGAGRLPFRCIIHVAGIDMRWRASRRSIGGATRNAVRLAARLELTSLAFPVIGSGSGGLDSEQAEAIMREALDDLNEPVRVVIVRYVRSRGPRAHGDASSPMAHGTPSARVRAERAEHSA